MNQHVVVLFLGKASKPNLACFASAIAVIPPIGLVLLDFLLLHIKE